MDDVKKMFQILVNGQSAMKAELLKKIEDEIKEVRHDINRLDLKIDKVDEKLTKSLDKIGKQLAFLEDDTPTREEFEQLENEVNKIKLQIAST